MSTSPLVAGALGCFALLAAPCAAQKLLDVLPKDTLAFVGTDDQRGWRTNWDESSTGRMNALPEFAAYHEALGAEFEALLGELLPGLDVDFERTAALLDGPCALACLEAEPPAAPDHAGRVVLALLAGVKGHGDEAQELLDGLVASLQSKGVVASHEQDGETDITTLRPPGESAGFELRLAIHADVLLATATLGSAGTDWLARLFEGVDGQGRDALAQREDVRASPVGESGPDLRAWMDLRRAWEALRALILARSTEEPTAAAVFGVLDRLGMSSLRGASLRMRYAGEGTSVRGRLDWPAGSALRDFYACFLARAAGADLLQLAPPDALGGVSIQVDWDGLLATILRGIQEGGGVPAATVASGFAEFSKSLGFDVGSDLLERLDGRVAGFLTEVPAGEAFSLPGVPSGAISLNVLLAIGASDRHGLGEFLDAQIRRAGLHAARQRIELMGFEVFHLPVFPGIAVDYALLPDCLVLSTSPTLVQDAVRRAAQPDLPDLATLPAMVAQRAKLALPAGMVMEGSSKRWMELSSRLQAGRDPEGQLDDLEKVFGDSFLIHALAALARASKTMPPITAELAERYFAAPTVSVATADDRAFSFELLSP